MGHDSAGWRTVALGRSPLHLGWLRAGNNNQSKNHDTKPRHPRHQPPPPLLPVSPIEPEPTQGCCQSQADCRLPAAPVCTDEGDRGALSAAPRTRLFLLLFLFHKIETEPGASIWTVGRAGATSAMGAALSIRPACAVPRSAGCKSGGVCRRWQGRGRSPLSAPSVADEWRWMRIGRGRSNVQR